jgi:hypothetical protein
MTVTGGLRPPGHNWQVGTENEVRDRRGLRFNFEVAGPPKAAQRVAGRRGRLRIVAPPEAANTGQ